MKRFKQWLKSVGLWACRAPVTYHYWLAIGLISVAIVVIWECGWSERAFRITGMTLQIFGVFAAVWGICKTQADFGRPSLWKVFFRWFQEFPTYGPNVVSSDLVIKAPKLVVEAHGGSTHATSKDQTVEGRLKHLEEIVKQLEDHHWELFTAVRQSEKRLQHTLDERAEQLYANVSEKIETTATSGSHIASAGVILLLFGTIFSGAAPELNLLLASSSA